MSSQGTYRPPRRFRCLSLEPITCPFSPVKHTVMAYGSDVVWQLGSMFNSLFKIASGEIQRSTLLSLCEDNPTWPMGSAHKEPVMRKEFTCDENFMQYIIGKGVMKKIIYSNPPFPIQPRLILPVIQVARLSGSLNNWLIYVAGKFRCDKMFC